MLLEARLLFLGGPPSSFGLGSNRASSKGKKGEKKTLVEARVSRLPNQTSVLKRATVPIRIFLLGFSSKVFFFAVYFLHVAVSLPDRDSTGRLSHPYPAISHAAALTSL